jgi:hypothetical protein
MPNIDVTIRKSVTKSVTLQPDQVEAILADYARRELGFANPEVTLDAGFEFLKEARISSSETEEHIGEE